MAVGAAVVGGMMSMRGASQQRRAGKQAAAAGEETARGIEAETEMNIEQTRRSQSQTLGLAKANIAASGVRFDASKIAAVEFTEGATGLAGATGSKIDLKFKWGGGIGGLIEKVMRQKELDVLEGGIQTAGETTGDSTFNYLREMKREFSKDIAWQTKEGRSRAKVARMGGQVAKAQAYAGATQSYASAISSFGSAYGK